MSGTQRHLSVQSPPRGVRELAYVLPMGVFLVLTQVGAWWPSLYIVSYIAKTLVVAALLVALRRYYSPIRFNGWWLGVIVVIIGIVQWVGTEKMLLHIWPDYPRMAAEPIDPFGAFASSGLAYSFIAFRWAAAVLVVPVMEELFWRDFLWRSIAAPADFRLANVGEWDASAFLIVAGLFATVHVQWLTALIWALLIGLLLLKTRSLGACILAHAVTNLLLGAYVLWTHDWYFW
jgi:hypothetical protein